jgi:capsular exopolysaccharide synthesis family protein
MAEGIKEIFGEVTGGGFTVKEHIYKHLAYWPLFLVSLFICVGAGIFYTRYATPIYKATTLILVKGDQNNGGQTSEDLIRTALEGKEKTNNLDNEIQLMTSTGLMERVVSKNQFNISYYKLGNIRKIDLYLDIPFRLIPEFISDSNSSLSLNLMNITNSGGIIKYGPENKMNAISFHWDIPFLVEGNRFLLTRPQSTRNIDGNYMITWNPVKQTAEEILGKFSVEILDKKTSIIKLDILIENLKRGQDILNAISREFNAADIEDKNAVSEKTIRFIDERLAIVLSELSGVEGNLENYQGNNQIINVASQSSQSFENANDVSKNLTSINVQQGVVKMIQDYFTNSNSQGKLVPSSLGINDATLASLIARYNELQLKKERDAPSLAPNGILLKDLTNQINSVKGSILENLQNITKNLKLQENSLQQKNGQYREFLSALPHKERVMQEIKRKQSITEGLYLYLLQKREETSISASSSNVSIYKQIDTAKGYGPVQPNTRNIKLYSIVLGLLIPLGWIRLRDILNDKIIKKNDITSRTPIPLIGELSHIPKRKRAGIIVMARDVIGEQFRMIRTNLSFLTKKTGAQVILVTSSTTGEGKSLVSLNLAAVLATPGNKVALLEFDMRLPGIAKNLELKVSKGLSNYLAGETNDLCEIQPAAEALPSLHLYPSGLIPLNPADLLLNERISKLFEQLKLQYDYVIIDSAPVELVTDAFILGKYSNAVIYIIRQEYTAKKKLDFINEIYKSERFTNMCIIFNDVKSGGKYGSGYGHATAYEYSYGKEKNTGVLKRIIKSYQKTMLGA